MADKQSLGTILGGAECYLGNMAELAANLQEVLVEEDGSTIKIDNYQEVVAILQVLWNAFKETAQECEGKNIEVKFGKDLMGTIITAALSVLGFEL